MAEMTLEEVQAQLSKVTKELAETKNEAGAKRIDLKKATKAIEDMAPQLKKLKELEDAQKSQEELQTTKLKELDKEIKEKEADLVKAQFMNRALTAGVPKEKAELLSPENFSGTEEEAITKLKLFAAPVTPNEKTLNPAKGDDDLTMKDWAAQSVQERLKSVDKVMDSEDAYHTL